MRPSFSIGYAEALYRVRAADGVQNGGKIVQTRIEFKRPNPNFEKYRTEAWGETTATFLEFENLRARIALAAFPVIAHRDLMDVSTAASPATKLLSSHKPLVIGHRGYCRISPENTLPSFRLALAAGVDLVELDYRHSRDGHMVVIHDHELDRTTDARRRWKARHIKVAAHTAAEIQTLDSGHWFDAAYAGTRVPLLSEALDLIQSAGVTLIEHKAGDAESCVNLLRQRNLLNKVIVQSFDWAFLRAFHELEPEQVLGALGPAHRLANGKRPLGIARKLNRAWLGQAEKTGAKIIVWTRQVPKSIVRLAHERGFKVWVYTVNEARLARDLLRIGINGLITNNPRLIRGIVDSPQPKVPSLRERARRLVIKR